MEESKLNEYIQYLQEGLNPGDVNLICQDPSTTSGGANPNPNNQNNEPGSGGSTDNGANGNNQNNDPGTGNSTDNGANAQKSNTSQFSRSNKLVLIMFLMLLSI